MTIYCLLSNSVTEISSNFILGSTKVFLRKIPSGLYILSDLGEGHFSKGLLQSWLHYAVFNFRRKACRTKSWTQHIFLKCLIYQLRFLCSTYIVKLINFIQALTFFLITNRSGVYHDLSISKINQIFKNSLIQPGTISILFKYYAFT